MKDEMLPVTGSMWEQMLKDHYEGRPIPIYRPYIPLQWVDAKDWGRDIGKSETKQQYFKYLQQVLYTDKQLEKSDDTER